MRRCNIWTKFEQEFFSLSILLFSPTFASRSSSAVQDGESDAKDERIEKGEKEEKVLETEAGSNENEWIILERRKEENRKEEE